MPKINEAAAGHAGPAAIAGGHKYLAFADAAHVKVLKDAIAIIDRKIKSYKPCNDAFKTLPGGKSFADVWSDPSIWINYDPSRTAEDYGATRGKEITVTAYSLAMGRWTVVATLVHELAHVNGASGATAAAEDTLKKCLLKDLHDPGIIGKVLRRNPARRIS